MPQTLVLSKKGAMNTVGLNGTGELLIPSDPLEARLVQDAIERTLRTHHFDDHDIFSVRLAVEEALINAIKHGNQFDRTKKVLVRYHVQDDQLHVHIRDEGPGFDPNDVPDPLDPENLERPCGRGLLLIRHYMTEVAFDSPGNSVRMLKRRSHCQNGNGHV